MWSGGVDVVERRLNVKIFRMGLVVGGLLSVNVWGVGRGSQGQEVVVEVS